MKFIHILPYWKITYESELSKEEIIYEIPRYVEPLKLLRFPTFSGKPQGYEGEVTQNTFRIRGIGGNKNSFRPWAEGKMTEMSSGKTEIIVTFRMSYFTMFGLPLMLFVIGRNHLEYIPFILIGLILAIGIGFHVEANFLKNHLKSILKAEIKD